MDLAELGIILEIFIADDEDFEKTPA